LIALYPFDASAAVALVDKISTVSVSQWSWAVAANVIFAISARCLRIADGLAALLGGLLGAIIFIGVGPAGFGLMLLFVAGGSLLSRFGRTRKRARGTLEARAGMRGSANALANLSVPAYCALGAVCLQTPAVWWVAFCGALAAALADTAGSEVGTLSATRPRLIGTFRRVAHGTDGGLTTWGTVAGAVAAAAIGLLAWGSGLLARVLAAGGLPEPTHGPALIMLTAIVVLSGILGSLVDSLAGAYWEQRLPQVGKHTVNFLCTLAGAGSAAGLYQYLLG